MNELATRLLEAKNALHEGQLEIGPAAVLLTAAADELNRQADRIAQLESQLQQREQRLKLVDAAFTAAAAAGS